MDSMNEPPGTPTTPESISSTCPESPACAAEKPTGTSCRKKHVIVALHLALYSAIRSVQPYLGSERFAHTGSAQPTGDPARDLDEQFDLRILRRTDRRHGERMR